jgi:hypothetical protein
MIHTKCIFSWQCECGNASERRSLAQLFSISVWLLYMIAISSGEKCGGSVSKGPAWQRRPALEWNRRFLFVPGKSVLKHMAVVWNMNIRHWNIGLGFLPLWLVCLCSHGDGGGVFDVFWGVLSPARDSRILEDLWSKNYGCGNLVSKIFCYI